MQQKIKTLTLFILSIVRLDSNVYEAGSTANVHVNVDNDSSVDIDNFVLKVS